MYDYKKCFNNVLNEMLINSKINKIKNYINNNYNILGELEIKLYEYQSLERIQIIYVFYIKNNKNKLLQLRNKFISKKFYNIEIFKYQSISKIIISQFYII